MSISVRTLILIVVGIASVGGPFVMPVAHAGPLSKPAMAEARNHLAHGNKLYNVRSFDEAITEYKAGALVEPAPVFDYNLGQCYRLTGKYQEAIWHYERFLARGKPQGELLDAVNDFIAQMKSELDKKAMTQKPTEAAPPPPQVLPQEASGAAPGTPPQRLSVPQLKQPMTRRSGPWYHDKLGWGLAGAGVVGLTVGAGFLVSGSSIRADANESPSQETYRRLSDKASSRSQIGAAVGVVGTSLLVAGIIKLVVHSENSSPVTGWSIGASRDRVVVLGKF